MASFNVVSFRAGAVIFGCDDALVDTWNLDRALRSMGGSFLEPPQELLEEHLEPDPVKIDLLHELIRHGYEVAVCSRRSSESLARILKITGLFDLTRFLIGANNPGTPGPLLYKIALSALGISPEQSTIVEHARMRHSASQVGALRVLEVAGPHEVDLQLLPHVLDISDAMHAA